MPAPSHKGTGVSRPGRERRLFSTQKGNSMSIKLKILGLGVLAVMATSAFAAVNASAISSGHFTAEPVGEDHVIVKGTESNVSGTHNLSFYETNANGETTGGAPIKCTHVEYHGTLSGAAATTTTAIQVRPNYKECSTNAVAPHNVTVDVPAGCGTGVFEFTPRSAGHATVHVKCAITITHPNCTIVVPVQTPTGGGVTYTTTTESNKHAITLNSTVTGIHGQFEGGICVFLGTNHVFEMIGSVTVWGENTLGGRVGVTHT